MFGIWPQPPFFLSLQFYKLYFLFPALPHFLALKSTEYFHFSQICKLQNPKQQIISEMADLLKIMRPKYLSFERKKKVKINLADLIEPNGTQTMRTCLVFIFFVALQNIWGTVGGVSKIWLSKRWSRLHFGISSEERGFQHRLVTFSSKLHLHKWCIIWYYIGSLQKL